MKKTLFATLLTLIIAVTCAFGLAACKKDGEKFATSIKVGDNKLAEITVEGTEYDVEGELYKEYTLTAMKDGVQCDNVILFISAGANGTGTMSFEYTNLSKKVKISSNNGNLSGVTVVMAERTYPAGDVKNPVALTIGDATSFTVSGSAYYFYTVTVDEDGIYSLAVTGDVSIQYANALNGEGDGLLEDEISEAELTEGRATVTLKEGVNYIAVTAADFDATSVTGTIKVEYVGPVPEAKEYITVEGVTIDSLTSTGKVYFITAPVDYEPETNNLKFTAKVNGVVSTDVTIAFGNNQGNPVEGAYSKAAATITVSTASATAIANVTVEMEVVDVVEAEYDEITVGTAQTVEDGVTYIITLSAGDYSVATTGFDLTGAMGANVIVSPDVYEGEADASTALTVNTDGTFTVETAGEYYVTVYGDGSLTVSEVTA